MTPTLYPELTPDEVGLVITPLADCLLGPEHSSATRPSPVLPQAVSPTALGPVAETFSFEHLASVVAEAFRAESWDTSLDSALEDPVRFAADLRRQLVSDFLTMAIRPLADSLQPRAGMSPEAAYVAFCRELLADGLAGFADDFPVAFRRIRLRLRQRVAAAVEMVGRVVADRADLTRVFGAAPDALLSAMTQGGDTHSGGRAVSTLTFSDGTRVVLKPRPVDCEAAYARLCEAINRRWTCRFRAAEVLARDGYGYMAFVEADDRARNLRDIGALTALMYALNARDMHFSNIISTAEGAVPVDLETLLHPHRQKSAGTPETAHSAYRWLESSVFGTGVLPLVITRRGREGFVDVGFLGGGEVRGGGPFRTFRVENPFRADLRVAWDDRGTAEPERREGVDSATARAVRAAADEIVDGFTEMYNLISGDLGWFDEAVAHAFASAEVRYIHNPTVQYDQCLRMLTGSAAGRDHELARGLTKRIGIASRNADPRLVRSECEQLWNTDVPYFLIGADKREITDGSPARSVVAAFDRSPLQQQRAKTATLSEQDLQRQVRLIRLAFNAKLPDPHEMTPAGEVLAVPTPPASRRTRTGALRDLAGRVGRFLVDEMVEDRYAHLPRTWIGPVASANPSRPWPPGVLDYDLYTGRVGPALALAALGRVLEEEAFLDAADSVFSPAARILDSRAYEIRSIAQAGIGAFNGFSGTLWAMAAAGDLMGRHDLLSAARAGRKFLADPDPSGDEAWFDLVSGGVGALIVRLALGGDDTTSVDAATASARCLEAGLPARMEHSGLAHGLGSLILFGARAYGATGRPEAKELVVTALGELRQGFGGSGPAHRTRRDGAGAYTDSWCNGSAGLLIALSEAARHGLTDDSEPAALVDVIRSQKLSISTTLCHGVLGLHAALGISGTDRALSMRDELCGYLTAERISSVLADHRSRYNQSPSLMVGRAGIGWHLATRLTDERMPAPLNLSDLGAATGAGA
jgi:type 2 lantibiotic biosynthesis protein LanM